MASKPVEGSWDFGRSVSTLVRSGTRRSPMLTHETSPVSGASVVGMTTRVGQGQSHLPADVPGISTALSQRGRHHLKGRLRQQTARDFTEESQSQRRRRNSSNGRLAKSGLAPTRSTDAGDKRDASYAQPPPISGQDPPPRKDPRQSEGDLPRRCWSKEKRHFIKLPASGRELEDGGATSRPWPRRSRQPSGRPPNL
jgi:hypothetical protein